MSKKYFYPASPTRKHFALSELPEQEIAEILEAFQQEGQEINDPFDCDPIPPFGEISQKESELFTTIASQLSEGSMPYGKAILLTATFACTIEDRVRHHFMN